MEERDTIIYEAATGCNYQVQLELHMRFELGNDMALYLAFRYVKKQKQKSLLHHKKLKKKKVLILT